VLGKFISTHCGSFQSATTTNGAAQQMGTADGRTRRMVGREGWSGTEGWSGEKDGRTRRMVGHEKDGRSDEEGWSDEKDGRTRRMVGREGRSDEKDGPDQKKILLGFVAKLFASAIFVCIKRRTAIMTTTTYYTIETIKNYRTIKTRRFDDYVDALDAFEIIKRKPETFFLFSKVEIAGDKKTTSKIATK